MDDGSLVDMLVTLSLPCIQRRVPSIRILSREIGEFYFYHLLYELEWAVFSTFGCTRALARFPRFYYYTTLYCLLY